MTDIATQAAGIGALAEPVRRALYEFVVEQPEPVGREAAAAEVGVPAHKAKFHLDRLVDEGLLEVEFRRLSGKSGPGAGRPSKLYRRSEREWAVSLPGRRYDLVGHILADGVERAAQGVSLDVALTAAAVDAGTTIGSESSGGTLADALSTQGYEPRVAGDVIVLANCPFDSLAQRHTELVCGLNRSFVQGVADGLGCSDQEAYLEPEPEQCCVKVRPREEI
jgi:predicted ArsR family transcriptional regulator